MAQNDKEDDYEYEETIVMVELQGIMENDFLGQVTQAKILGIDTEKPLLQLDDYTFTGKYSDTMGTGVMFEEKTEPNDPKPGEKKLEYSCLTNKKLCLQRVFLKDNKDLSLLDTKVGGMEIENGDATEGVKKVHTEKTDVQSNAGAGTSDTGVAGTSNASVAGTSNASVAGTSNAGVAGTSDAGVAGTSNASVAGTSDASVETDFIHLDSAKTAMEQDITSKTVDIEEVSDTKDTKEGREQKTS